MQYPTLLRYVLIASATSVLAACGSTDPSMPAPRCRAAGARDCIAFPCAEAAGPEAPAIVRQSLGTPGRPLDQAARAFFEPRFGRDFSAVRIHADGVATAASRSISARAFTLDSDIAFADGQYDSARPAGRGSNPECYRAFLGELLGFAVEAGDCPVSQSCRD